MRELNCEQLKQVSGGIILGVSDANTYMLIIPPNDMFFFSNFKTGDTYLFSDNGNVMFVNPINDTSYSISFPFKIANDQLCEYSVPSSFFKFSA